MQTLPGGGTSLSAAELRIVPLLASHLTLQEIADRLFLSRHTVKTHSIAIYRKLGVSSRREAIGAAAGDGPARGVTRLGAQPPARGRELPQQVVEVVVVPERADAGVPEAELGW